MAYYSNVEELRQDIERSADSRDYNRYITDPFFSENEQSEYYAAKARIYKTLGELAAKYAENTLSKEQETIKDKISLLQAGINKTENDPEFAKQFLQSLSML